jgi:hypothetical protein
MKNRLVMIAVVVGLVVLAVLLRRPVVPLPATPEQAAQAMLDVAAGGDDEAYLALLDDELRESLRNTRSQVGVETFRRNLRESATGIVGLATSRGDEGASDRVSLDVEIVYTDRTERQRIVFTARDGGWVITAIAQAEVTRPTIRYGTPVSGP